MNHVSHDSHPYDIHETQIIGSGENDKNMPFSTLPMTEIPLGMSDEMQTFKLKKFIPT